MTARRRWRRDDTSASEHDRGDEHRHMKSTEGFLVECVADVHDPRCINDRDVDDGLTYTKRVTGAQSNRGRSSNVQVCELRRDLTQLRVVEAFEAEAETGEELQRSQLEEIRRRTLLDASPARNDADLDIPTREFHRAGVVDDRLGRGGGRWRQVALAKDAWSPPPALPRDAPLGLTLGRLPTTLVDDVLAELRPLFGRSRQAARVGKSSSQMFEVGWSFLAAEQDKVMRREKQLDDCPKLRLLLAEAVYVICGSLDLCEPRLNVICRQYSRGQGIPMHFDRKELFDEDVYTCILENSSDGALEFRQTSRSGDIIKRFRCAETPGSILRMRGESRYVWLHGVDPPLTHGQRFSVTWRWIAQRAVEEFARGGG